MASSKRRTETLQVGHHIIAIYDTIDDERNEAVMVLTEDIGKEKLLKRMKESKQEPGNLEELEKRGDVTIESTSGWYFPDGTSPNPDRIIPTFVAMVDL